MIESQFLKASAPHLEIVYWNNGGKHSKWLFTKNKVHDVVTTSRFKRKYKYD